MELKAQNISKTIKNKLILDDISVTFIGGNIYVIRGANGSGKTMLLRALSGLMSIDSGTITLDGKVLRRDYSVLPSLGIMLENVSLYPNMTGFQNLEYLAKLRGRVGKKEIIDALDRVGLDIEDKRTYRKYSLGMKQRLAIAQAIMESPDVILLDEPTNALDRNGVSLIHKLLLEEKQRGALVVIATHSMEDIRLLADYVYEMEYGRLLEEKKDEI